MVWRTTKGWTPSQRLSLLSFVWAVSLVCLAPWIIAMSNTSKRVWSIRPPTTILPTWSMLFLTTVCVLLKGKNHMLTPYACFWGPCRKFWPRQPLSRIINDNLLTKKRPIARIYSDSHLVYQLRSRVSAQQLIYRINASSCHPLTWSNQLTRQQNLEEKHWH